MLPGLNLAVRIEWATGGAVPTTSWVTVPAPAKSPTPSEDAA